MSKAVQVVGKKKRPKKWKVTWVPIKKIKLWKDNPRKHPKAAVDELASTIKQHGLRTPLSLWRKNMVAYKGNTTLKALKKLGYKEAPCVLHRFKNEREAEEYGIADNRAGENTTWDDDLLARHFGKRQSLSAEQLAARTGFKQVEIEGLQSGWDVPREPKVPSEKEVEGFTLTLKCPECGHKWRESVKNQSGRGLEKKAKKKKRAKKGKR